jgi:pyruvate/2-oxoacid:ferredoxin oxidoreductase alpha subunit
MKKVITGNRAAAYGAVLSRPQLVSAYPITPQTTIVEYLAAYCADGSLDARFINVESEHSAMSACIGAAATGVRTFTASSSHGLALMHEMLHVASYMRLPIVMAVANRAMGIWNIHADQTDSLSQRDTGWMHIYCENGQEVVDSIIQAYRISEQVLLPCMVTLDGFLLSHTSELVDIPGKDMVDRYLPAYNPAQVLDATRPLTFGACPVSPEYYLEFRYMAQQAMDRALSIAAEADNEFRQVFGRGYGLVDTYWTEDATTIIVTTGTIASTTRIVIDERRAKGEKIGMLRIRMFRPFPKEEIRRKLAGATNIGIIDRDISFGQGGIIAEEVNSALNGSPARPVVCGFIAGLGGRDVTPEVIDGIIDHTTNARVSEDVVWVAVKK